MKIRDVVFISFLFLTSGAALAADNNICSPNMICASDPQTVVVALQDAGLRAKLENQSGGAVITSALGGYNFYIYANDCEAGWKCSSLQFNILFAAHESHTAGYANGFNLRYRYLQLGTKDNSELRLTYDITTIGGLNKANFNSVLSNWANGLNAFSTYVQEQDAEADMAAFPTASSK